jgi:hypothetical protein
VFTLKDEASVARGHWRQEADGTTTGGKRQEADGSLEKYRKGDRRMRDPRREGDADFSAHLAVVQEAKKHHLEFS